MVGEEEGGRKERGKRGEEGKEERRRDWKFGERRRDEMSSELMHTSHTSLFNAKIQSKCPY